MNQPNQYVMCIDGPLFRSQRALLIRLADLARKKQPYEPSPGDVELLEGLLGLTDAIADQAHDRHGIDCLLAAEATPCEENDNRCECENPGFFYCGVPGIIAHLTDGFLTPEAAVQRCDLCQRYPSDEAAFEKLRELGHVPP